jgi:hypothetical protein
MIFKKSNKEIQLGLNQEGPILDELKKLGLTHDSYQIPEDKLPDYLGNAPKGKEDEFGELIGRGSERIVFKKNDQAVKYPHPGVSTSHGGKISVKKTHLDKLIHSLERVMELRIFARVCKIYGVDVKIPDSIVDEYAIIRESLLPENRRSLRSEGEYEKELLKFMPRVIKDLYVYFDLMGGGNMFQVGETPKGNQYSVIDGARFSEPGDDLENELNRAESYHNKRFRFNPFDREKAAKDINKFKAIIARVSQEELERMLGEIRNMFNSQKISKSKNIFLKK